MMQLRVYSIASGQITPENFASLGPDSFELALFNFCPNYQTIDALSHHIFNILLAQLLKDFHLKFNVLILTVSLPYYHI